LIVFPPSACCYLPRIQRLDFRPISMGSPSLPSQSPPAQDFAFSLPFPHSPRLFSSFFPPRRTESTRRATDVDFFATHGHEGCWFSLLPPFPCRVASLVFFPPFLPSRVSLGKYLSGVQSIVVFPVKSWGLIFFFRSNFPFVRFILSFGYGSPFLNRKIPKRSLSGFRLALPYVSQHLSLSRLSGGPLPTRVFLSPFFTETKVLKKRDSFILLPPSPSRPVPDSLRVSSSWKWQHFQHSLWSKGQLARSRSPPLRCFFDRVSLRRPVCPLQTIPSWVAFANLVRTLSSPSFSIASLPFSLGS